MRIVGTVFERTLGDIKIAFLALLIADVVREVHTVYAVDELYIELTPFL